MWLNVFEITDSCFNVLEPEQFCFIFLFCFKSNLCTRSGAWTQNREIESHISYQLSQAGTPILYLFIYIFLKHLDDRVVPSPWYFGIVFFSLILIDIVMYVLIYFSVLELLPYHFEQLCVSIEILLVSVLTVVSITSVLPTSSYCFSCSGKEINQDAGPIGKKRQ